MPTSPVAHGPDHLLIDHLRAVAALAAGLQGAAGGQATQSWAHLAGLWHDLGKFRPGFQRYVRQDADAHIEGRALVSTRGRDKTHSAAGALQALHSFEARFGPAGGVVARVLAQVIAGHHAGLYDWHGGLNPRLLGSDRVDSEREFEEAVGGCRSHHPELLALPPGFDLHAACAAIPALRETRQEPLALSLWVRMLFSALVDADFLDTEAYFDRQRAGQRHHFPPLSFYSERLDGHLHALARSVHARGQADAPVMQARAAVLRACRSRAKLAPGVYSLSVPTGGGKTLASLAFALDHARAHGLRRVIVAIPYTSIVEQTADVFAQLFGREAVVEHHSQADGADDRHDSARSRLACENWDAPLIVTTNVQLLESLFASRTSRCRKLHNIARSVIVLDEAQLLPPPFLQPILDALRVLVRFHGCTLLLCTATQPVLVDAERFDPAQRLRGLPAPQPIVEDEAGLYAALERVRFEWPADWQTETGVPDLAAQLAAQDCVLAIVNTRKDAAELCRAVDALTAGAADNPCLHLSAALCGQHRADVIHGIGARLAARRAGQDTRPLRVVSTQLVEAGVDVDFPVVYRALAGLDSIAQAAGRCNREGALGRHGGRVVVFVRPIPAVLAPLRHAAQATVSALAGSAPPQTLAPELFQRYFPLYYANFHSRDARGIVELLARDAREFAFDFRTAAERFRLVDDDDQASVVVPYVPAGGPAGTPSPATPHLHAIEQGQPDRWRLRALQRYIVNARQRELAVWQARGDVRELLPGLYVLVDPLRYDARLGLLPEGQLPDAATLVQ